jgi:hypothetical protein
VTTAAFDEPFEPLERLDPLDPPELLARLLPLPEERDDPEDRDAELRLRDDADEDRPLDALVLGFDEPLREDPLRVFGLDPFELRLELPLEDFRFVPDPEPDWAIFSSLIERPAQCVISAYPDRTRQNALGTHLQAA